MGLSQFRSWGTCSRQRGGKLRLQFLASVLLVAIGGGGSLSASAAEPTPVFHGVPHDMLYAMSMDGDHGIAVGDFGLVVETQDGGSTWNRQAAIPGAPGLFGVVRKSNKCIAGGQMGLILFSDDCHQWKTAPAVTSARILSVSVNASGVAYAVGGFGTLLRSTDWGKTWQAQTPEWKAFSSDGAEPHLYDVHVADSGEVTVVGEFEMVIRSRDDGAHWNLLHKGKRSLFALSVLPDGEIYAAGQEGLVLKATDGGTRWAELPSGTQSILTGLWAKGDGKVVVSGIYTVLYSTNGGRTWQADQSKSVRMGWHQAVVGKEDKDGQFNVVLAGSGGAILSVRR